MTTSELEDAAVRIVCISDTHGGHDRLTVPDGDLVLFGGDLTQSGGREDVVAFNRFLGGLSHDHKVVVAGNHDGFFERKPGETRRLLSNADYLCDERVEYGGVVVYGSPWQPQLVEDAGSFWSFDLPRGKSLERKWAAIPDAVDLLLTHAPPHGVRDEIYTGEAIGCRALADRVDDVAPDIHVFGHVHEEPGVERYGGTTFVNASCPGGFGSIAVLEYDPSTGAVEIVDAGDWLPEPVRRRMRERAAQYQE